jgi:cytochrome b subunit of formate dehydrogenase
MWGIGIAIVWIIITGILYWRDGEFGGGRGSIKIDYKADEFSKFDDFSRCGIGCGGIVHIRYDFGDRVSIEHFRKFRIDYAEAIMENEREEGNDKK